MITFCLLYAVGVVATYAHQCKKLDEEIYEKGYWPADAQFWARVFFIEFWPIYWLGRLIMAPAQLLLPEPGEPQ